MTTSSTTTASSWTLFLLTVFLFDGQILQPVNAFSIFSGHNNHNYDLSIVARHVSSPAIAHSCSKRAHSSLPIPLLGRRHRRSDDDAMCLHLSSPQQQQGVEDGDFVEAEDLPSIQALFNKYCDKDGLMTKSALAGVPVFAEMLVRILKRAPPSRHAVRDRLFFVLASSPFLARDDCYTML